MPLMVLQVHKAAKLAINKDLASKYRHLQNEHMIIKDKMMNNFDDRVKIEARIKDTTQVCNNYFWKAFCARKILCQVKWQTW